MALDPQRFANLDFESFRALAVAPGLSRHEKVGFPDAYREGLEPAIFRDVLSKLPSLQSSQATVMEIGPGCSALPVMLIEHCEALNSQVWLVDSAEMLALLPSARHVHKLSGLFPRDVKVLLAELSGRVNTLIAYSVLQYVFTEGNLWEFFDQCLGLLADGGEILFGDIPNQSMRKRFFASADGEACHRRFTGRDERPEVHFNRLEAGAMDDSVVLALLARARAQGFHAWVVPQALDLPMANRREDLLIRKP